MKKYFILLLLLLPTVCFAKTINILDLTMDLDEEKNVIVTRDNIKDNKELKKIGINEVDLINQFEKLSCYLDAVNKEESKEVLIFVKDVDLKRNLHKYKEEEIKDLEEKMIESYDTFEHGIYSIDNYKYIYMYYMDGIYYVMDYYTAINGKGYTIKFQSKEVISEEEKELIKNTINSINFNLDKKYEKSTSGIDWIKLVIILSISFVLGAITAVIKTKIKNRKE